MVFYRCVFCVTFLFAANSCRRKIILRLFEKTIRREEMSIEEEIGDNFTATNIDLLLKAGQITSAYRWNAIVLYFPDNPEVGI